MTLLVGSAALEATGTLPAHSDAFQAITDENKCVISSRSVGKYATGLLRDGYATKGFHNKAKSCNWGPMAGFVLSDPRFTKRGDSREAMEEQRKDIVKAFKEGSGEVPVYITESRRVELLRPALNTMRPGWEVDYNNHYYYANSPSGKLFLFHLQRTDRAPGAYGKPMWAVQYAYTEAAMPGKLKSPATSKDTSFLPVTAIVDVATRPSAAGTYLSATTGDYDLFAVFPQRSSYNRKEADKRAVPGSDRFRQPIKQFIEHEDKEVGNITPRIARLVAQINARANHAGGNIVHHSDEAGRPLVNDIDFPFIAWIPGKPRPYAARNVSEFKELIALLKGEYVLALNPGWLKPLGIGVSGGGSYEV
ncbi:hypothetical protein HNQ60_005021 [Povalibacter uvarum]|uniref:Anthrax toxin edema factor central domain-containing protein n=1 Tax=Povalibacter uvarum TaxID=732238 RepID=A0A841HVB5_9GAMM|nr:anthrax toxin-like adenylyl cyclase domain-containing protein [Povalibacter uvarum]MBB6096130.1 hypothetical protein [Povalibacter uvarum]